MTSRLLLPKIATLGRGRSHPTYCRKTNSITSNHSCQSDYLVYSHEIQNHTMGSTTINASCLCKGIQFTVTGQSKGAVLCHCSNCKSFHGSAFAHNYRMMKTKVEYKQGKELLRSYKDDATKSGKVLERFFCSKCVRFCDLDDCHFCIRLS